MHAGVRIDSMHLPVLIIEDMRIFQPDSFIIHACDDVGPTVAVYIGRARSFIKLSAALDSVLSPGFRKIAISRCEVQVHSGRAAAVYLLADGEVIDVPSVMVKISAYLFQPVGTGRIIRIYRDFCKRDCGQGRCRHSESSNKGRDA
jgi:hypothetical protein